MGFSDVGKHTNLPWYLHGESFFLLHGVLVTHARLQGPDMKSTRAAKQAPSSPDTMVVGPSLIPNLVLTDVLLDPLALQTNIIVTTRYREGTDIVIPGSRDLAMLKGQLQIHLMFHMPVWIAVKAGPRA
jgi:hypothetical protein